VKSTLSSKSSGEHDFYGVLREILEIRYPGPVHLHIVLFKYDRYDTTIGEGVRINRFGIIDVNVAKSYGKYDPFILASHADQVCYVPYPRKIKNNDQQCNATVVIQLREKILLNQTLDFTAMREILIQRRPPEILAAIKNHILFYNLDTKREEECLSLHSFYNYVIEHVFD